MLRVFFFLLCVLPSFSYPTDAPVLFRGRFRPVEAYAQLWLQDYYHAPKLKKAHLKEFGTSNRSAHGLLWKIEQEGALSLNEAPLFAIRLAETKKHLGLPLKSGHFSYLELYDALYGSKENRLRWQKPLLAYLFLEKGPDKRAVELSALAPGLWLRQRRGSLEVSAVPQEGPWSQLEVGQTLHPKLDQISRTKQRQTRAWVEELLPLISRIQGFPSLGANPDSPLFPMLPPKRQEAAWSPLSRLQSNALPPSTYPPELIQSLQSVYPEHPESIENILQSAYQKHLAGSIYQETAKGPLRYPSMARLKAEGFYYRYPLVEFAILAYTVAFLMVLFQRFAYSATLLAFLLHTGLLGLRCFILGRPPVSNMFETILYVPWICVLIGLSLRSRLPILLAASNLGALCLLVLLKVTHLDSAMENVQAVLDSQYWLTIHVLMVVGSYGIFLLGALLGHAYLLAVYLRRNSLKAALAPLCLRCLYIGTALLIPGTILGGVWAAESWGRFWDWDPKESWAFISSCVYLIVIHLHRFRAVGDRGLAVGACLGFLVISFTWYGVNYILGTGLHSYGFGSGGEGYYYSFVFFDVILITSLSVNKANLLTKSKNL